MSLREADGATHHVKSSVSLYGSHFVLALRPSMPMMRDELPLPTASVTATMKLLNSAVAG